MSTAIEWWNPGWREAFLARAEEAERPAEIIESAELHALEPPSPSAKGRRRDFVHGGQRRPQGSSMSRFVGTSHHADRKQAALAAGHAALRENRSLFPSSVVDPAAAPRLLVSGHNSAKTGSKILKGPWRGLPIYTLTLEERATCPTSCSLLAECYGNAMPFARRHRHGPELIAVLDRELREKHREHRRGFAVRLHVLGDFYAPEYVLAWLRWMNALPRLRVWGYTAHPSDTPIGGWIARANERWPERWVVRHSVTPNAVLGPAQATTVWRAARGRVPEGIVCPAQTHDTAACGTCGLCWHPAARDQRIVFIGHGKRGPGRPRKVGS